MAENIRLQGLRIALVANTSWNLYHFRQSLIQHLLSCGAEVWAIAPADDTTAALQAMGVRYLPIVLQANGMNPLQDIRFLLRLWHYYREYRFDVSLHFTIKPNLYGSLAARLSRTLSVSNVSGLGTTFLYDSWGTRIARTLYRLCLPLADWIFFQNEDDQALFVGRRIVSLHKSSVLPGSGVDLDLFRLVELPATKPIVFLLIARMRYDKGVVEYVEASRRLLEQGLQVRCQLLGRVADRPSRWEIGIEQIRSWEQAGWVEYCGETSDVRPFIAGAHCVVLPSYREGTSRALLEAAAMGRPLITTAVPGCQQLVQPNVNGYLCRVQDADSLARAMQAIYQLQAVQRQQMGLASRQMVENRYDVRHVVQVYENLIYQMCAR